MLINFFSYFAQLFCNNILVELLTLFKTGFYQIINDIRQNIFNNKFTYYSIFYTEFQFSFLSCISFDVFMLTLTVKEKYYILFGAVQSGLRWALSF